MTVAFQNGSFLGGTSGVSTLTQSGGVTSASLYNTDYLDSKYDYTDTKEGYETAYAGRDAAIETSISNIISYLEKGQEDKAIVAYETLLSQMQSQTRYSQLVEESGDDTQLRSIARQLIEAEAGTDLEELIRDNTRDSIGVQKQKLYRGDLCDSTTQEELLLEMCNIDEEEGQLNIIQKGWHGFWGGIAKAWNSVFGDGKKH